MHARILTAATVATLLAACASNPGQSVIIDTKGVDMNRYYADLDDCTAYAEQVQTGENVARGAARGAVVGGAIGAMVRGPDTAERGAGIGAVSGAAKGVARSEAEQNRVVRNCLRGRGYRVLN